MTTYKILVIEDEEDIAELISYNLKKDGFIVDTLHDGEIAYKTIQKKPYDLIILDLMIPGINGIELCKLIRNNPSTSSLPIIMLTAKTDETDRIIGLELGADDYITKPFSPRELIARIKAVLRRTTEKPQTSQIIKIKDLEIDKEKYMVSIKGKPLKLSATEFKLLLFLVERKGKVFTRDQLLDAIWRDEAFVEPRTVDVHIRRLRSQIEKDPSNPEYIKTLRGIGYFFSEN